MEEARCVLISLRVIPLFAARTALYFSLALYLQKTIDDAGKPYVSLDLWDESIEKEKNEVT
jgi:hypothetical protein